MANEFLRLACKGAKFNKKRFSKDFSLFEHAGAAGPAAAELTLADARGLDFFGNQRKRQRADPPAKTHNKKQKKKSAVASQPAQADPQSAADMKQQSASSSRKANKYRKKHNIRVKGLEVPAPARSFKSLRRRYEVPEYILKNLQTPVPQGMGYGKPTPIQSQAIPTLLEGRQAFAVAPTGSGKTAAFIVPILTKLKAPASDGLRALVLSPTKELTDQIHRHFLTIAAGRPWDISVLTKANANKNTWKNKSKDILIATPLRLIHALENNIIDLSALQVLVMDEADRLFDDGFAQQIDSVISACNWKELQICLFSATLYQGVELQARNILKDPIRITVGTKNAAVPTVAQRLVYVGQEDGKLLAIRQIIQQGIEPPALLFVQSKERARQLYQELVFDGINVDVIHADRSPAQRAEVIKNFRNGGVWVLICTDLMARGMDFKGVNLVINYDFPQSAASYIHRLGRAGRAGRSGSAVTLFTDADVMYLRTIANVMQLSGCEVPEWMLKLRPPSQKTLKTLKAKALPREPISDEKRKGLRRKEDRRKKLKSKRAKAKKTKTTPKS